ncbi:hypothetical protein Trydic_g10582 [Trypoxylus dichotomus]
MHAGRLAIAIITAIDLKNTRRMPKQAPDNSHFPRVASSTAARMTHDVAYGDIVALKIRHGPPEYVRGINSTTVRNGYVSISNLWIGY